LSNGFDAAHPGYQEIHKDEVRPALRKHANGVLAAFRRDDGIARGLQNRPQHLPDLGLVIHD
jgi:hypothetical protein